MAKKRRKPKAKAGQIKTEAAETLFLSSMETLLATVRSAVRAELSLREIRDRRRRKR